MEIVDCRDFCRETTSKSVAMEVHEAVVLFTIPASNCFVMSNFAQSFTSLLSSCCWLLTEGL